MSDKDWKCSDECIVCEYTEMLLNPPVFREFEAAHELTRWERFKKWLGL